MRLLIGLAPVLLLIACTGTPEEGSNNSSSSSSGGNNSTEKPIDIDKAERGAKTWETECAVCHGATGEGRVPNGEIEMSKYSSRAPLITKIVDTMPTSNPKICEGPCAEDVAEFMYAGYPDFSSGSKSFSCNNPDAKLHKNTPIRMLTTEQYSALVGDVYAPLNLDVETMFPDRFLSDNYIGGFINNSGVTADFDIFKNLKATSATIATQAADSFGSLMNCNLNDACIRQYAETYAKKLYRFNPSSAQIDRLMDAANKGDNDREKIEILTGAMLQSPYTLYVYQSAVSTRTKLSGPELASRLSYFIWNAAPDAALIDAASRGSLDTISGLEAEVDRMLADPRSLGGLMDFYKTFIAFEAPDNISFNGKTITAEQILSELERFVSYLTLDTDGKGSFEDLILSRKAFVDENIATLYGVSANGQNTYKGGVEVELDADERAGLMTRIAYSMHGRGHGGYASPTERGSHFRAKMMCQSLPNPPGDVVLPEVNDYPDKTWVEVVKEIHLEDVGSPCEVCHRLMDPVGFAFEHYGYDGSYINSYPKGQTVDASGVFHPLLFQETSLDNATFADAIELSELYAASPEAKACFARNWLARGLARDVVNEEDSCAYEELLLDFQANDYSLRELIIGVVTNSAFRFRNPD